MRGMDLENIARAVNGELFVRKAGDASSDETEKEASCVVIDSRKLERGGIFVATKGERADGHSFIGQVLEKGALGVICEKKPDDENGNYILVKDSFDALKRLAAYYRSLFDIPAIGIIGSMGKTSTKEMVAAVLSERYRVHKTEGNYNNEVGVPLTILGLRDEHEIAVIEMGINQFGEMTRLAKIVRPDSVVMTNIGPCHLEFLHDLDGVFRAKTEVFEYMTGKGRAILNGDDERLSSVKEVCGEKPIFYGLKDTLDVCARRIENRQLNGTDAVFDINGEELKVHIPLPGEHSAKNALAGAAAGYFYGLDAEEIRRGIANVKGVSGRLAPIKTESYLLIDDCYNANPTSMMNAIKLLADTGRSSGRKTGTAAVLGDMFELGEDSGKMHREVGCFAAEQGIDRLITVGERSEGMYEAAKEVFLKENGDPSDIDKRLHHYRSTEELLQAIDNEDLFKEGDTILLKASHAMHFEKAVERLSGIGNG
ncbi:MAG TPA: UDP-N-acetylmuramoylalanyl-D-glutamyl-2, 6-diaminopimelate--D-alanyl-D-alanine ligase [Lachnospiraceae bacterium]|nr:UDP-N-acetylmuramoylalanyl-D-glutamyl-2, 6-diaminopimelate--D-alanyl-D-alanine ligase [Lachnospiraceae bacterium]